jgi:hypothetical protein
LNIFGEGEFKRIIYTNDYKKRDKINGK